MNGTFTRESERRYSAARSFKRSRGTPAASSARWTRWLEPSRGGSGVLPTVRGGGALVRRSINDFLGIDSGQRRELSAEELERVLPRLDEIADEVEADLRRRLDG